MRRIICVAATVALLSWSPALAQRCGGGMGGLGGMRGMGGADMRAIGGIAGMRGLGGMGRGVNQGTDQGTGQGMGQGMGPDMGRRMEQGGMGQGIGRGQGQGGGMQQAEGTGFGGDPYAQAGFPGMRGQGQRLQAGMERPQGGDAAGTVAPQNLSNRRQEQGMMPELTIDRAQSGAGGRRPNAPGEQAQTHSSGENSEGQGMFPGLSMDRMPGRGGPRGNASGEHAPQHSSAENSEGQGMFPGLSMDQMPGRGGPRGNASGEHAQEHSSAENSEGQAMFPGLSMDRMPGRGGPRGNASGEHAQEHSAAENSEGQGMFPGLSMDRMPGRGGPRGNASGEHAQEHSSATNSEQGRGMFSSPAIDRLSGGGGQLQIPARDTEAAGNIDSVRGSSLAAGNSQCRTAGDPNHVHGLQMPFGPGDSASGANSTGQSEAGGSNSVSKGRIQRPGQSLNRGGSNSEPEERSASQGRANNPRGQDNKEQNSRQANDSSQKDSQQSSAGSSSSSSSSAGSSTAGGAAPSGTNATQATNGGEDTKFQSQIRGSFTETCGRMSSALQQHQQSGRLSQEQMENLSGTITYASNLDRLQRLANGGAAPGNLESAKVENHLSGVVQELNRLDPLHPVTPRALNSLKDGTSSEPLSFYRSCGELKHMLDSFHESGKMAAADYERYTAKLQGLMGQEESQRQSLTGQLDPYQERDFNGQIAGIAQEVASTLEPN